MSIKKCSTRTVSWVLTTAMILFMVMNLSPEVYAQGPSLDSFITPAYEDSFGNVYRKVELIEADLNVDGQNEMVAVYKGEGTSSLLGYQVWQNNGGQWSLWHEKEGLYQGQIQVHKGKLVEKIPIYQKNDANALPSSYTEKVYTFAEQGAVLQEESTKSAGISLFSTGQWTNPPRAEIEAMLHRIALEKGVPPVIVKSIAYAESNLRQFHNGQPLLSFDGKSWGIMQVSPGAHGQFDEEKLKYNIEYNIAAGIEILLEKWSLNLTTIGNGDPRTLENWYFSIWAYNGWSQWNNPNMLPRDHGTWVQTEAYQEKVIRFARSQFGQIITPIPREQLPTTGLPLSSQDFATPQPEHLAAFRSHKKGEMLIAVSSLALRNSSGGYIGALSPGTKMEVIGGPVLQNKYIRYEIKTIEPNTKTGWIAMNWALPTGIATRLAGSDRYATAVAISKDGYPQAKSANAVVIARCDDFGDALPGGILAVAKGGPLLLSQSSKLPSVVIAEITRVLKDGGTIYLLGGSGAVSEDVKNTLQGLGNNSYQVKRIAGSNREETALKIAEEIGNSSQRAIVSSAHNFPDALAISSYAAREGIPILLTRNGSLSEHALQYLTENDMNNVYVTGGTAAVSQVAYEQIAGVVGNNKVERLGGANRFDTARIIANKFFSNPKVVSIVYGRNFPDALAGGVNAAGYNAPMLLVELDALPTEINKYVTDNKTSIENVIIYGGSGTVSDSVKNLIESIIQ